MSYSFCEKGNFFCMLIISWGFLFMSLIGFPCFSILLSLLLELLSSFCTVFDAISSNSNIDKIFFINLSSKVFIFRDFNFHYKDWLNFSEGLMDLLKSVVIFNQSQETLLRWSLFLLEFETMICIVLSCSSLTLIHTWFLAVCVAAIPHGNNFHMYQQNKGKGKRGSSCRLAIVTKVFLKLSSLSMLIKQNNLSLCRDFACWKFSHIC